MSNNYRAIFYVILSTFIGSFFAVILKSLYNELQVTTIGFFRFFFGLLILSPIILRNNFAILKTSNLKLYVLRSSLNVFGMLLNFTALGLLTLEKSAAFEFVSPIYATIFAVFILKEKIRIYRVTALFIGFIGAIIVLRPDIQLGFGPLLILLASLMWSSSMLMAKVLTKTDSTISITFWQAAGLIPATFLLAIQVWEWPTLYQLFLFLMVAVAGTLVHWFLNEALKRAEISALLPLDYLRLIWAVSFGFIFFDELPHPGLWLGAALILGASTYIGIRQAKKKKEELNTNTNINI